MITLIKTGFYRLIATRHDTKILYLNDQPFVWIGIKHIGEVLALSHYHPQITDYSLAEGRYRIYGVEGESRLADLQHLELEYGKKLWQGYLLLTGLPTKEKRRVRIVPSNQIIVSNPYLCSHVVQPLTSQLTQLQKEMSHETFLQKTK
jgi:hypothetical protein